MADFVAAEQCKFYFVPHRQYANLANKPASITSSAHRGQLCALELPFLEMYSGVLLQKRHAATWTIGAAAVAILLRCCTAVRL